MKTKEWGPGEESGPKGRADLGQITWSITKNPSLGVVRTPQKGSENRSELCAYPAQGPRQGGRRAPWVVKAGQGPGPHPLHVLGQARRPRPARFRLGLPGAPPAASRSHQGRLPPRNPRPRPPGPAQRPRRESFAHAGGMRAQEAAETAPPAPTPGTRRSPRGERRPDVRLAEPNRGQVVGARWRQLRTAEMQYP
nr:translation initiation factor IF-2-like [Manis javanica]